MLKAVEQRNPLDGSTFVFIVSPQGTRRSPALFLHPKACLILSPSLLSWLLPDGTAFLEISRN